MLPLLNQSALEEEPVTLACRLNKPAQQVTWFRDGVQISPSDERFEMRTEACNYTLSIDKSEIKDTGMFTMRVGEVESSATVIVYGETTKQPLLLLLLCSLERWMQAVFTIVLLESCSDCCSLGLLNKMDDFCGVVFGGTMLKLAMFEESSNNFGLEVFSDTVRTRFGKGGR